MHQQEEGLQSVVSSLHFRAATGKGIFYNYNVVTFSNRQKQLLQTQSQSTTREKE
jgi:hypothetical protein